jgi:hypothetical protein
MDHLKLPISLIKDTIKLLDKILLILKIQRMILLNFRRKIRHPSGKIQLEQCSHQSGQSMIILEIQTEKDFYHDSILKLFLYLKIFKHHIKVISLNHSINYLLEIISFIQNAN